MITGAETLGMAEAFRLITLQRRLDHDYSMCTSNQIRI
jgi:hypothetical protein